MVNTYRWSSNVIEVKIIEFYLDMYSLSFLHPAWETLDGTVPPRLGKFLCISVTGMVCPWGGNLAANF